MDPTEARQEYIQTLVRGLHQASREYEATRPLKIMVMGPKPEEDEKKESNPAKLRKLLIQECKALGSVDVQPEHKDVQEATKQELGAGWNLTLHEIGMADASDLIVIIPRSAGSIAELGYFAMHSKFCGKMIILFDKAYERSEDSYISRGPRKSAKDLRARVEFVDYSRFEESWAVVKERIEILRSERMRRSIEAREG